MLQALGLAATSGAAIRSARTHADRLGLDYRHFSGGRRWTDAELSDAVAAARTWGEVARALGLVGGSSERTLRAHAERLALDVTHLGPGQASHEFSSLWPSADPAHLARAGAHLAAAWFALRGWDVAWPTEPCRYDLLVTRDATMLRIQVKTTTVRAGSSWTVWLSTTRRSRTVYGADEIDFFFVVDGDRHYYVLPLAAVGGRHQIHLSAYSAYRVDDDCRGSG
ncbi:group I intron-associated PD-(D/E)XK endonuclease [Sporichthya polymorpha]|uniref:group I intron-associated PD-(D/E)XK endonuclease n=1 Tax=Sporichthya polymorpha TaxID=35751 RepID=UPI000375A45A|nr:group I intron-associated PD-(D/E)XK endonuclease [Sporichthya polymorpha]